MYVGGFGLCMEVGLDCVWRWVWTVWRWGLTVYGGFGLYGGGFGLCMEVGLDCMEVGFDCVWRWVCHTVQQAQAPWLSEAASCRLESA